MRLLLLEDDVTLGEALADYLGRIGHAVDLCRRVDDAEAALQAMDYDQVLLDLNLPDGRGLDLLARMRAGGRMTPVIILTARDRIGDRLAGLDGGADDYMIKPFDLAELSARIGAVARRPGRRQDPERAAGDVSINLTRREVRRSGRPVDLTGREWAVLARLAQRADAIVSKAEIEDALYAFGAEIESNAVEVYVSRLRRKLGRETIVTLRGIGYRLAGAP